MQDYWQFILAICHPLIEKGQTLFSDRKSSCWGQGFGNIYTLSTHYLHNIYFISTQACGATPRVSVAGGGGGAGSSASASTAAASPPPGPAPATGGTRAPGTLPSDDPPCTHIDMSLYRCDIPCSPGFYGVNCRQACPPCNASKS